MIHCLPANGCTISVECNSLYSSLQGSTSYFLQNRTWKQKLNSAAWCLTHWGRVTHICVSKLAIIGSDNGLSPDRRQAIIWINAGILLIRTLGTNFSEILCEIHSFSFSKMHLRMSSATWCLFGLGLNELIEDLKFCTKEANWVQHCLLRKVNIILPYLLQKEELIQQTLLWKFLKP